MAVAAAGAQKVRASPGARALLLSALLGLGRGGASPTVAAKAQPAAASSALTVRALPGRLSAHSGFYSKYSLYGALAWGRRALKSPRRRFPARADEPHSRHRAQLHPRPHGGRVLLAERQAGRRRVRLRPPRTGPRCGTVAVYPASGAPAAVKGTYGWSQGC
jgi:hypothetical protein